jgi:hypothetical protein
MKKYFSIILLSFVLLIGVLNTSWAQKTFLPFDTLSNDDIQLLEINLPALNIYCFSTTVTNDSVLLVLPEGLPRGYYEVYYNQDTNCLALAYYNYGWSAYIQQFYKDGTMKSDTECNSQGTWHGLHILYYRNGTEAWHAEFINGVLDKRYRLDYLEVENVTEAALKTKKLFGKYSFSPTPSRARKDQIELKKDATFIYSVAINQKAFSQHYSGTWTIKENYLQLELQEDIWQFPIRKFVIKGTVHLTHLELIEIKDWGVEWYRSEYKKK